MWVLAKKILLSLSIGIRCPFGKFWGNPVYSSMTSNMADNMTEDRPGIDYVSLVLHSNIVRNI